MPYNILLITTDQHRYDALGANGNSFIQTPNLDRLAREGIRFRNHSTSCPLCTPARASILTGQYPETHGAWDVGVALPENTIGLAHWLKSAGYSCGLFGKAHFKPQMSGFPADIDPHKPFYGFDHFAITEDNQVGEYLDWVRESHSQWWDTVRSYTHDSFPPPPDTEKGRVYDCYVSKIPEAVHQTSWITDKTLSFIETAGNAPSPFFAWCSFIDPHHPWNPIEKYASLYLPEDLPPPQREAGFLDRRNEKAEWYRRLRLLPDSEFQRICAAYYGMISHLDSAVGKIIAGMEKINLLEDTIVLFTSDHGEYNGDHCLLRKGSNLYDGILKVPMIMRMPGRRSAGITVGHLTQHEDIAPTLLELVGEEVPESVQGVSFASFLKGEGKKHRVAEVSDGDHESAGRRYAYYHHPANGGIKGIRNNRWKLVHYPRDVGYVLTDLEDDPCELANMVGAQSGSSALDELKEELLKWLLCTPPLRLPKKYLW